MNPEIAELSALRQVSDGKITIRDGGYVHGGRPVTGEPAEALVRLHTAGCLTVGVRGPGGHRPVRATVAGAVRAAELAARHD